MAGTSVVGVLGAYGTVGRSVCEELAGDAGLEIRAGGRDARKVAQLGEAVGVAATPVDVLDDEALRRFCRGCDVVVNTTGPARVVRDRVARAAADAHAHYVDPGGDVSLQRRIADTDAALRRRRLAVVLSAGWITGMTGVLPTWVVEAAGSHLDRVESVEVVYGDVSDWSLTGFEDILDHVLHHSEFGWYEHGRWVARGGWRLFRRPPRRAELPGAFGTGIVVPHYERELTTLGAVRAFPKVSSWAAPLLDTPQNMALMVVGSFSTKRAARVLSGMMRRRREHLAERGFVAATVHGERDGAERVLHGEIRLGPGDEWVTGAVCATAVRHVLRSPRPGIAYLCDAVDVGAFVADMGSRGLEPELSLDGRPLALPSSADAPVLVEAR